MLLPALDVFQLPTAWSNQYTKAAHFGVTHPELLQSYTGVAYSVTLHMQGLLREHWADVLGPALWSGSVHNQLQGPMGVIYLDFGVPLCELDLLIYTPGVLSMLWFYCPTAKYTPDTELGFSRQCKMGSKRQITGRCGHSVTWLIVILAMNKGKMGIYVVHKAT